MTDNYPIHNAVLNFKTAINKDEAVWMMLRLLSVTPDTIDKYADDIEFSLEANLTFFRETLVGVYEDAQNDTTAGNPERALQELKDFDEDIIRRANLYLSQVEDEFAKGADSKFRFKDGLITINSFNDWFSSLNIIKVNSFNDPSSSLEVIKVNSETVTVNDEFTHDEDEIDKKLAGLYTTLAFALEDLAKLYAEKGGKKALLKEDGTVHQENMAEHLQYLADNCDYKYDQTSDSTGQKVSSLKNRISLAFNVKKDARKLVEDNKYKKKKY